MAEELIYTALANVMADMSAVKKSKKNTQGAGFNYRGIDDVMNALHPALVKNGVVVVPQVIAKEREERQSKSGGLNIYSIVTMSFKFLPKTEVLLRQSQLARLWIVAIRRQTRL